MKTLIAMLILCLSLSVAVVQAADTTADQKPAAAGTALPADGGDPGKAYMEYCKAMTSGDMKALRKLVSTERAKAMDDPEFAKMFPMIQSMMAKDIKITGGTLSGNSATLNATGKDGMGGASSTGTISMILEDKQWKVEKDSWKSEAK